MITASCHCGAVQLRAARRPTRLTRCTCSICHRYGALWAYYTRKSVTVKAGRGVLKGYRWGDRVIEFMHCSRCGCLTHYQDVRKGRDQRLAINARMMPPGEIADIRVRTFDGADTWRYLD